MPPSSQSVRSDCPGRRDVQPRTARRSRETVRDQCPIRQNHGGGAPHGERVRTFIDPCTQLKFLGCRKANGTEHASILFTIGILYFFVKKREHVADGVGIAIRVLGRCGQYLYFRLANVALSYQ